MDCTGTARNPGRANLEIVIGAIRAKDFFAVATSWTICVGSMIWYEMYCCTIYYTSQDLDPVSCAYERLAYRMDRQAFSFCQPQK